MIATYIILTTIFAGLYASIDLWRIQAGKHINHTVNALTGPELVPYLICCTVFWLIFDHTLNILRKKPFFYVGKTAIIDTSIGQLLGGVGYFFMKLTLLICLSLYYVLPPSS